MLPSETSNPLKWYDKKRIEEKMIIFPGVKMLRYTFTSNGKLFTDTDIGVRGLLKVTPHWYFLPSFYCHEITTNNSKC